MAAIRQGMGDRAMVCGFIRVDGMRRLVAVTAAVELGDPLFLMAKEPGRETEVTIYYNTEVCDGAFLRLTDKCTSDGYRFMGKVEVPLPILLYDPTADDSVAVMADWADRLLRSATFELERLSAS